MKGAVEIDDDDVIMVDPVGINNSNKETCEAPVTVTIDDGTQSGEVSDIEKDPRTPEPKKSDLIMDKLKEESFVKLLKNNALLNKIVQRCLNMENNCGMSRVVHKTLLPLYKDVNNTLKQSDSLTEALQTVLNRLKNDPDHKFLHIKNLCDGLKEGRFGRKVPFITLTTDLKKHSKKHTKMKTERAAKSRRKSTRLVEKYCKKIDVIDLDNSDESDQPVTLDLSDESDREDLIIVEETHNGDRGRREESNKENSVIQINTENESNIQNGVQNSIEINKDNSKLDDQSDSETDTDDVNRNIVIEAVNSDNNKEHFIEIDTSNIINIRHNNNNEADKNESVTNMPDPSDCNLLTPHNSVSYKKFSRQYKRVIEIENKIKDYKQIIQQLEEQEVTNNSQTSPYILCDKYKANVVALYKKLCKITGNGDGNLMKQRVVRLHAVEGHPQGPVKMLEAFLNSTIDNTGAVPLPDFDDVASCVNQANLTYNLGWSTEQIMREAFALFTHCGHALRKQRQKREYKDLLSLVEDEDIDEYDPANQDPELQRRLEENMKIAKANEDEILERYVQMENHSKKSKFSFPPLVNTNNILQPNTYDGSESDSDLEPIPQKSNSVTKLYFPILYVNRESSMQSQYTPTTSTPCRSRDTNINVHNNVNLTKHTIPAAQNSTIVTQNTTVDKEKPTVYKDLNVLQKIGASNQYVISYNSDTQEVIQNNNKDIQNETEKQLPISEEVKIKLEDKDGGRKEKFNINILFEDDIEANKNQDESISNKNQDTVEVKLENGVKKEPVDIQKLLDTLGDNYVSTIFDIEDPFVIVEISDSSDED